MIHTNSILAAIGGAALLALTGCITHVAGKVIDERGNPVQDATIYVGRPDGVGSFGTYKVDSQGRFDFHCSPTDESFIYVWNGRGDKEVAMKHIDRTAISEHMEIKYNTDGLAY